MRNETINEVQLRNIITNMVMEEIERSDINEGLWNQMKAAFGGATAGTGTRMKNAASNAATAIGNAARGAGRAMKGAYDSAANAVGNAYNNAAQGAQKRYNAAKGSFNAQRNMDKINKLIGLIDELTNDGTLHGNAMMQAVNTIKSQLSGAVSREKGTQTAYRNSLMPQA